jgi:hypothetical protein
MPASGSKSHSSPSSARFLRSRNTITATATAGMINDSNVISTDGVIPQAYTSSRRSSVRQHTYDILYPTHIGTLLNHFSPAATWSSCDEVRPGFRRIEQGEHVSSTDFALKALPSPASFTEACCPHDIYSKSSRDLASPLPVDPGPAALIHSLSLAMQLFFRLHGRLALGGAHYSRDRVQRARCSPSVCAPAIQSRQERAEYGSPSALRFKLCMQ